MESATGTAMPTFLEDSGSEAGRIREASVDERPRASLPAIFLAALGAVTALYVARDVFIPFTLAILLTLLLRPAMRRLKRLHWPDTLASFVIVAAVAVVFIVGMVTVAGQGQAWLAEAPQMIERVEKMLPSYGPLEDFTKTAKAVSGLGQAKQESAPVPVVVHSNEAAFTILGASGHFLAAALIVFVLAYFLLAFSDRLLNQAVEAQSSFTLKRHVVGLLQNVESGISRYLAMITLINIGLGAVTALMLWLLGLPNPILWGVVAMTLNYVPHIGAALCMALLFLVGAVARESLWFGAGTAVMFCFITSAESYFITPLALSKSLQLSPLAVILSILFWGWMWGIAGGLMAAPLLAVMKIVCDQFDSLRPLAIMLSADFRRSGSVVASTTAAKEMPALPSSA